MTIATRLDSFLTEHSVGYAMIRHPHTESSMETAASAHVPGERLAKAVIVKDGEDFLMVVVPSDYHLHLGLLHRHLGREVGLATESEVVQLFPDCDKGAIPPLGSIYGLRTLIDTRMLEQPEVFLESGDHETLVRIEGDDFRRLAEEMEKVDVGEHV